MASSSTGARAAPVELFSTSILGNHKVRSRHERYVSVLTIKKVPYVYHDLASDEEAKARWRRKARDPQIPGLLVHNEWRGTFEEFEEAIEFGELDLFLNIDHARAQREAEEGIAPTIAEAPQVQAANAPVNGDSSLASETAAEPPRKPSKFVVNVPKPLAQPRAPSNLAAGPSLPTAAPSTAKRRSDDPDSLLRSLGLSDASLSEAELAEILQAGEKSERGIGNASTSASTSSKQATKPVARTYIPSSEAGVKPLRLAKMGSPRSPSASDGSVRSPHARYNASVMSSKALAAEAQASASGRAFSAAKLRDAVSQGDDLKGAMASTRAAANADETEQIVGREDLDSLMSSLGLGDVQMTDAEAEAFLLDGSIPAGMAAGGARLGRSGSQADRARQEAAAHDVAERARQRSNDSAQSERSSKAPVAASPVQSPTHSRASSKAMSEHSSSADPDTRSQPSTDEALALSSARNKDAAEPALESASHDADARETEETPRAKTVDLPALSGDTAIDRDALKGADENAQQTSGDVKSSDTSGSENVKSVDSSHSKRSAGDAATSGDVKVEATSLSGSVDAATTSDDVKAEDIPLPGSTDAAESSGDVKAGSNSPSGSTDATTPQATLQELPSTTQDGDHTEATTSIKDDPQPSTDSIPDGAKSVSLDKSEAADISEDQQIAAKTALPSSEQSFDASKSVSQDDVAEIAIEPQEEPMPKETSTSAATETTDAEVPKRDPSRQDAIRQSRRLSALNTALSRDILAEIQDGKLQISEPQSAPLDAIHEKHFSPDAPLVSNTAPSTPSKISHKANLMRGNSTPPSGGRRRAIDIPRAAHSPSSSALASPPVSLNNSLTRASSGSHKLASPVSSPSLGFRRSNTQTSGISQESKSPGSRSSKRFFGFRKSSKDSTAAGADSDDEEEISTTFDNPPPKSRADSKPSSPSTKRHTKTLSMILREADEALDGVDEDGGDNSDDGIDAFHLEISS